MTLKHSLNGTTNDGSERIPLDAKIALNNAPPLTQSTRKKSLRLGIKEIYFEYCSNTSLHGIQYLGQRRPWKEIVFWLFVFIVSLYYCSIMIDKVYVKWMETPVIVSFSEHSTPIYDIPFPAVTICPETRRYVNNARPTYSQLLELVSDGHALPSNLSANEREEFLTLLHSCNYDSLPDEISRLSDEPIDYIRVLQEMAFSLSTQFPICKWYGVDDECYDLFTTTYTEDGLCYTFNGFNGTDLYREDTVQYQLMGLESFASPGRLNRTLKWSLEKGYAKKSGLKTYPARVVSASTRASFDVVLTTLKEHLDYGCSGATQGFKVVLHTPDDVPLLAKRYVRVSLEKEVTIAVKPVMVTTSDGISAYSPEKRKCYLNGERELRFFKVYSQKNCEMECLTNYTLRECSCVKYAMPRTRDMAVCAEDKINCYLQAEDHMLLENFVNADDDDADDDVTNERCNCMPSCTSLEYDAEISQGDIDVKEAMEEAGEEDTGKTASNLIVYFKEHEFVTSKRSELYGFSDFLANCGGILGLFMGFSFLSVVEVLYHLSLRLWSNMTRKREL